jgi:hypothetical protein
MAHDDQCFRAVLVDGTVVSLAVHWSRRFGGTWTVEGAGYHEEPRLAAVTACRARGLALAELRGPGEATTAELLDLMKAAIAPEVEAALRASADLRAWREQAVEDATRAERHRAAKVCRAQGLMAGWGEAEDAAAEECAVAIERGPGPARTEGVHG